VGVEYLFKLLGAKSSRAVDWIAAVLFVAIFVFMKTPQSTHMSVDLATIVLVYVVLVLIVLRFGLVPLAVGAFTVDMLANVPFTADFSEWYAGTTVMAMLIVVTLAGWGFYHSLGAERVWKVEME
jgi:hypothetical protein